MKTRKELLVELIENNAESKELSLNRQTLMENERSVEDRKIKIYEELSKLTNEEMYDLEDSTEK